MHIQVRLAIRERMDNLLRRMARWNDPKLLNDYPLGYFMEFALDDIAAYYQLWEIIRNEGYSPSDLDLEVLG